MLAVSSLDHLRRGFLHFSLLSSLTNRSISIERSFGNCGSQNPTRTSDSECRLLFFYSFTVNIDAYTGCALPLYNIQGRRTKGNYSVHSKPWVHAPLLQNIFNTPSDMMNSAILQMLAYTTMNLQPIYYLGADKFDRICDGHELCNTSPTPT